MGEVPLYGRKYEPTRQSGDRGRQAGGTSELALDALVPMRSNLTPDGT